MLFTMRSSWVLYLSLPLFLDGCQSSFKLAPDSHVPRRWANDARVRGCRHLAVGFSSWEGSGEVTARIRCINGGSSFSEKGAFHWAEPEQVVATATTPEQLTVVCQFESSEQFYKAVKLYRSGDRFGEVFLRLIKEVDHRP